MINICYVMQFGETTLHVSAALGYLEIVSMLVNNGIDLSAKNNVS
jgi:hypothetical protein